MINLFVGLQMRATILVRHFSQSTTACLVAMTKGNLGTLTLNHWKVAMITGLGAGIISLIFSFGNLVKFQTSRYGVAFVALAGTLIADLLNHGTQRWQEVLVTGLGAAVLSLFVSFTPLDGFIEKLQKKKEE